MPWRTGNLAIAYYNKEKDIDKALASMKKALDLDPGYSRFLQEYDQLCSKAGVSNENRLALLESRIDLTEIGMHCTSNTLHF